MPLKSYAVLTGRPIAVRLATGASRHYQVLVSANGVQHRIAVNVQSADGSEVEFLVRERFENPLTAGLADLPEGLRPLERRPGGLALDYIRGNLAQPWEFTPLPFSAPGPDNDLNEKIDALARRAMADEWATIHAFGEPWGPEPDRADRYFGFLPGRGIHDIHMNQGNPPGRFAGQNGPWQDGGLLFRFPRQERWAAVLLKFKTQAWHTDDRSGATLQPADSAQGARTPLRDTIPDLDLPDGLVRIVAALVDDTAEPERETVTLLNVSDRPVDLEGWSIADRSKARIALSGTIGPGETQRIPIRKPVVLSNKGGLITLLDARGLKVHGVGYTKEQVRQPGRTMPFQQ